LCGWKGELPVGIVGAVFPSLAEILIREDDVVILRVLSSRMFNKDWPTSFKCIDFSRISRDISMVLTRGC
jgi:hypothetical protein